MWSAMCIRVCPNGSVGYLKNWDVSEIQTPYPSLKCQNLRQKYHICRVISPFLLHGCFSRVNPGRFCAMCDSPLPERSDRTYKQRKDCGNQSRWEHPENDQKPLVQFTRALVNWPPRWSRCVYLCPRRIQKVHSVRERRFKELLYLYCTNVAHGYYCGYTLYNSRIYNLKIPHKIIWWYCFGTVVQYDAIRIYDHLFYQLLKPWSHPDCGFPALGAARDGQPETTGFCELNVQKVPLGPNCSGKTSCGALRNHKKSVCQPHGTFSVPGALMPSTIRMRFIRPRPMMSGQADRRRGLAMGILVGDLYRWRKFCSKQ